MARRPKDTSDIDLPSLPVAALPAAYAVIYRPQRDGTWTAELADAPNVVVRGVDIDAVKTIVAREAKDYFDKLRDERSSVPPNHVVVGYVRPDTLKSGKELAKARKVTKADSFQLER